MNGVITRRIESKCIRLAQTVLRRINSNLIGLIRIGLMQNRTNQTKLRGINFKWIYLNWTDLRRIVLNWIGLTALVFLIGITAISSLAQEPPESKEPEGPPPVMIRSSLEPETGVYVGQKVRLHVEVLTNTWFAKAPQFPELRIPHAICLELSQFGVNFAERIEGETYAAQRKEYAIYPQRAERYSVPSLIVDITYARPGEPHGEVTLNSPPQVFEAQIPEKAKGVDYFVTTPHLQVNEEYDRGFDDLKVGDSLTRSITMIADDSVGMLLPPLDFGLTEGLGVYPASPRMEDESNRGVYTGKRFESVTYVMEKEGDYTLPEITIHWFDLQNEKLKTETLPGVKFSVAANPDLEQERLAFLEEEEEAKEEIAATQKRPLDVKSLLYLILALALLFAALWIFLIPYLKRCVAWWKRRRSIQAESEEAYFKRFRKSFNKGDPKEIMQGLLTWLDKIYPGPGAATIDDFVRRADDLELQALAAGLKDELYGKSDIDESYTEWSARDFYRTVSQARKRLMRKEQFKTKPTGLQPLNP